MIQAVALSGGPDSLCAAALMPPGYAFIVDHGLRQNSAKEAQSAAQLAQKLGHEPHVLRWDPQNAPRTQATYRAARYALLAKACEERGVQRLWLGHQQDDQIETLMLRFAKASGFMGLSGMAQHSWLGNTRLYRPLLTASKSCVLDWLTKRNLIGLTDPSNDDLTYPRVLWRKYLKSRPKLQQSLRDLAFTVGGIRNRILADISPTLVSVEAPGVLHLSGRISDLERPTLRVMLGECIRWVGARLHAPLAGVSDFVAAPPRGGASFAVGGALLSWNRTKNLFSLVPEARHESVEARLAKRQAHGSLWIVANMQRRGGLILGARPRFDQLYVTESTPNPLATRCCRET